MHDNDLSCSGGGKTEDFSWQCLRHVAPRGRCGDPPYMGPHRHSSSSSSVPPSLPPSLPRGGEAQAHLRKAQPSEEKCKPSETRHKPPDGGHKGSDAPGGPKPPK